MSLLRRKKKAETRLFMGKRYDFISQYNDRGPAEKKAEKLHKKGLSVRITSGFVEAGLGVFRHPALKWAVWSIVPPIGEIPKIQYDLQSPKGRSMSRIGKSIPRITPKTPKLRR